MNPKLIDTTKLEDNYIEIKPFTKKNYLKNININ